MDTRPSARGPSATGTAVAALAAALLYVLASSPHDLEPLAWLAPPVLLLPVVGRHGVRAALPGLLFGTAIAVGITHWAWHASLAYFDMNALATAAFVALVWLLYGGLPYAALTWAYAAGARRVPPGLRPLLAAWLWVVVEVARTRAPLPLPWGLLSHTQWRNLPLVQVAELGGGYAVTFVVVYAGVALGAALVALRRGRAGLQLAARSALPATALLALTIAYGAHARAAVAGTGDARERRVAVVQGAVPNAFRWQRSAVDRSVATYARLTSALAAPEGVDLVVWPENAVDTYIDRDTMLRSQLRGVAAARVAPLLLGAPRLAGGGIVHNSAHLVDPSGDARVAYDKRMLVPFAERALLPVADAVAAEPRYENGAQHAPLTAGGLSLGVLICFEVLFPDLVRSSVRDGATVLVNLSNDSWLDGGDGAAPRQHFAGAVLRAVETRRALVRASAGGVSGFVDPSGAVHDVVEWGAARAALGTVAPGTTLTPYVRWGDAWIALVGALLLVVVLRGSAREVAT